METSQIAVAIGLLVFLATLLTLYAIFRKPLNLKQRLNREEVKDANEGAVTAIQKQLERVLRPMGEWLPRSPAEMSRQERSLVRAGIRRKDAVILLNGAHLAIALLALAVFATTGHLYHRPILFVLLSIIIGAAIPDIWLKRRIERRKINIQHGLPDAMDLAVISVEAGLGLDKHFCVWARRFGLPIRIWPTSFIFAMLKSTWGALVRRPYATWRREPE